MKTIPIKSQCSATIEFEQAQNRLMKKGIILIVQLKNGINRYILTHKEKNKTWYFYTVEELNAFEEGIKI